MTESGYNSSESAHEVIDDNEYMKDSKIVLNNVRPKIKDFTTILNELTPESADKGVKLKFKKDGQGRFTILPKHRETLNQMESKDYQRQVECKNHMQGCPMIASPDSVRNHQLTCTFPPLKYTPELVTTKGVFSRKSSLNNDGIAKFVPFCNSFLHISGTQFLFKHFPSYLIIQTYSRNSKGRRFRMLLKSVDDRSWRSELSGVLGDEGQTVDNVQKYKIFQYQIVFQS